MFLLIFYGLHYSIVSRCHVLHYLYNCLPGLSPHQEATRSIDHLFHHWNNFHAVSAYHLRTKGSTYCVSRPGYAHPQLPYNYQHSIGEKDRV